MRTRALLAGAVLLVAAGCTSTTTTDPATTSNGPDPAVLAPFRAVVDEINATAGGPIPAQRAVLDRVADAGQTDTQAACGPATTTLSFEPVWADLAAAPDYTPPTGTLGDDRYVVPALIRIHTGDRITGTDLTALHFSLVDGKARTTALCVG